MARREKKCEPVMQWVLSEEMRTRFIERGWNTSDQFLINLAMSGEEFLARYPIPSKEERLRLIRED